MNVDRLEIFLSLFEEVELPLTLTQNFIHDIKEHTEKVPVVITAEIISRWDSDVDEYTEFIPCLKLPSTDEYIALVYWKGGLLSHEYFFSNIRP